MADTLVVLAIEHDCELVSTASTASVFANSGGDVHSQHSGE